MPGINERNGLLSDDFWKENRLTFQKTQLF